MAAAAAAEPSNPTTETTCDPTKAAEDSQRFGAMIKARHIVGD